MFKFHLIIKKPIFFVFLSLFLLNSCQKHYQITAIEACRYEVTLSLDASPLPEAVALLAPYKHIIDSIQSPILGESTQFMDAKRPASLLNNLAADILFEMAEKVSGEKVDMALTNIGGLRNSLHEGAITFGDVYNIFPFENRLCLLDLKGEYLLELFENIASAKGEAISHANMEMTSTGKLLNVKVNGKPIDPQRTYRIATLDYLAQGNDKMTALLHGENLFYPEGATIRQLVVDYIKEEQSQGRKIAASPEMRVTVVE